ncbi:hypothetical protein [Hydrogenimonas sp.]
MDSDTFYFKHGEYVFSISLENISTTELKEKLHTSISHQFAPFLPSNDKEALLQFHFCENLDRFFPYKEYLNIGGVKFANETLMYERDGLRFVFRKNNGHHVVYMAISTNSSLKSNCRLLNKGFNNAIETQVSLFYYRIFLTFTHLVNAECNTTYIHGATVSDEDGNAILFPADSGVGKSSMLFRMAQEGNYAYVADDLSIVSEEGNSYYAGRAISTKPYHLKNFPFLNELVEKEMPALQKLQWKFLKDNRLVFGIDPKKLFNGKIKEKAKIKTIVHLVNTSEKDFILEECDTKTLASASANILMNELILGNQIIYKALSIPGNTLFLSPGEIHQMSLNIYRNFFEDAQKYLLRVPYMSHPDKMYDYLVKSDLLK